VSFLNEDAIDSGGVKREFFSLLVKSFCKETDIFSPCGDSANRINQASLIWFARSESSRVLSDYGIMAGEKEDVENASKRSKHAQSSSKEYLFGVLIGLAFYHRILVNLPLPAHIYKIMMGSKVSVFYVCFFYPNTLSFQFAVGSF
jgi:hypothetical protein